VYEKKYHRKIGIFAIILAVSILFSVRAHESTPEILTPEKTPIDHICGGDTFAESRIAEIQKGSTLNPEGVPYAGSKRAAKRSSTTPGEMIGCTCMPVKGQEDAEFICPPPKEGYELVGFSYVKNFVLVRYWGRFDVSEEGYYWIKSETTVVDFQTVVDEIWCCSYEPIGWKKPDLKVVLTAEQLVPEVGEIIHVTATVTNQGEGNVINDFLIEFFIDGESEIVEYYDGEMTPGSSVEFDFETAFAEPGEHAIEAFADSIHTIVESNEDNNTASLKINVQEPKPVLTGVYSTFTRSGDIIEMYVRVVRSVYDGIIYDMEIFLEAQQPPWESIEVLEVPEGWTYEKREGGVRFSTETHPLIKCQRVKIVFRVKAAKISWYIRLHLTDEYHENLGEIVSTRRELLLC
jgi:hypothetical protein